MDIILLLPASLRSFPRYEAGCCEQYVRRVITGSYRIAELSLIEFLTLHQFGLRCCDLRGKCY